jgi:DNA primase
VFVRKNGPQALCRLIEEAQTLFDYKLGHLVNKFDAASVPGKEKIVREMLPTIKKFTSATTQANYLEILAARLSLDLRALQEDFKHATAQEPGTEPKEDTLAVEHYRLREIPVTERMLVKLMLEEMPIIDRLRTQIEPSDFVEEKLRKIVAFIFDFFCQGKTCKPSVLVSCLDDDEAIGIISELATLDIHDCTDREKLIADCVHRLKRDKVLNQCRELHHRIEEAQKTGTHEDVGTLIKEYDRLIKQRSSFHGETRS